MIPINSFGFSPPFKSNSRYIYNKNIDGNRYFFMYIKEFGQVHILINGGAIVVFDYRGTFSSQEEFTNYHEGYFEDDERKDEFLKDVKEKLKL